MTDPSPNNSPQRDTQTTPPANSNRDGGPVRDAELLRRFVRLRDEAAFAALVRRYGRLVSGVCRRVLSSEHDIEDAFQATFLVLARDAARIRRSESLASWLHGVAYRTSLRAVSSSHRRHRLLRDVTMTHEPVDKKATAGPFAEVEDRDQRQALDEELADLPDNYRAPLVLHYLEGKSNQQVADDLGLSVSAVEGRLKRGKKELRLRLARRGVGLSVAVAAMQAASSSAAAAPLEPLIARTIDAGLSYAGGEAAGPVYTPEAARLAGQEIAAMSTTSAVTLATVLLLPLTLGFSGHDGAPHSGAPELAVSTVVGEAASEEKADAVETPEVAAKSEEKVLLQDVHSFNIAVLDSMSKLGKVTVQIEYADGKQAQLTAAQIRMTTDEEGNAIAEIIGSPDSVARLHMGNQIDAQANRMRFDFTAGKLFASDVVFGMEPGYGTQTIQNSIEFGRASAWKSKLTVPPNHANRVQAALDSETECEFVDLPLDHALDYFAKRHNISILIDVHGLKEVGVSKRDIVSVVLSGVKLRNALKVILDPMGLAAYVEDDVLKISSKEVAQKALASHQAQASETTAGGGAIDIADAEKSGSAKKQIPEAFVQDMAGGRAKERVGTADKQPAADSYGGGYKPPTSASNVVDYKPQSENARRIAEELDEQTQVEFVDTPLSDAIDYISQKHDLTILIDRPAMQDEGVGDDEPINLILDDVQLRSVLNLMLRDLQLTTVIRDELLTITTKTVANSLLDTRVYNVRNLTALDAVLLAGILETSIPEAEWQSEDGSGGTITAVDGALIVMQTQATHEKIVELINQLQRLRAMREQSEVTSSAPADKKQASRLTIGAGYEKAQPLPAEKSATNISFKFQNAPWEDVLNQFAKATGWDIETDDVPAGSLTYVDDHDYSRNEALTLLNAYLNARGYELVPHDGGLRCQKR